MSWDTSKRKWRMVNAAERTVDSMSERVIWHDTIRLNISLKPEELRKDFYMKDKLTTPQLVEFIRREEARGTEGLNTLKVEYYRRSASPTAVLLLTLIGVVVASR